MRWRPERRRPCARQHAQPSVAHVHLPSLSTAAHGLSSKPIHFLLLVKLFYLPLLLCCRSASAPLREGAVIKPPSTAPWSRNLPQTIDRREELPEASRGHPPSTSAAPHCGQHASDFEPACRHLPELGTRLCCSPTRKPSSLTACAAKHRWLTPARVRRRVG
jgi:hypothetical protein